MIRVIFPIERIPNTDNYKYPDDKKLFDNYKITETHIIADYAGVGYLNLTEYTADAMAQKQKENSDNAQSKIDTAFSGFPQFEIDTFSSQQRDYEAYTINNLAPTPFVDGIIINGETKAELMAKIGGNITYIQSVQKTMREKEKLIKACTTQAELDAIVI